MCKLTGPLVVALCLAAPAFADDRTYHGEWSGPGSSTAKTTLAFPGGPLVEYCYQGGCFDFTEKNLDNFGFASGGAKWAFKRTGPNTIKGTYTSPKGAVFMSEYVAR